MSKKLFFLFLSWVSFNAFAMETEQGDTSLPKSIAQFDGWISAAELNPDKTQLLVAVFGNQGEGRYKKSCIGLLEFASKDITDASNEKSKVQWLMQKKEKQEFLYGHFNDDGTHVLTDQSLWNNKAQLLHQLVGEHDNPVERAQFIDQCKKIVAVCPQDQALYEWNEQGENRSKIIDLQAIYAHMKETGDQFCSFRLRGNKLFVQFINTEIDEFSTFIKIYDVENELTQLAEIKGVIDYKLTQDGTYLFRKDLSAVTISKLNALNGSVITGLEEIMCGFWLLKKDQQTVVCSVTDNFVTSIVEWDSAQSGGVKTIVAGDKCLDPKYMKLVDNDKKLIVAFDFGNTSEYKFRVYDLENKKCKFSTKKLISGCFCKWVDIIDGNLVFALNDTIYVMPANLQSMGDDEHTQQLGVAAPIEAISSSNENTNEESTGSCLIS